MDQIVTEIVEQLVHYNHLEIEDHTHAAIKKILTTNLLVAGRGHYPMTCPGGPAQWDRSISSGETLYVLNK